MAPKVTVTKTFSKLFWLNKYFLPMALIIELQRLKFTLVPNCVKPVDTFIKKTFYRIAEWLYLLSYF
jgi:hypothetical protein